MADVELLPCPFCGGTEICIGPTDLPIAGEYWTVGCNNDDCPLCTDSVMVEGGTLEKAAAVWNTRANLAHATAAQAAENERLRAEVAEWKRVASAQAELHGEAEDLAERLAEALREICTGAPKEEPAAEVGHSDNYGDVASWASEWEHYRLAKIARAALAQEDRNG